MELSMKKEKTEPKSRSRIYCLSMIALMTAVICVLAPMSVPIGPVPISLTNLAIYLSLYLLGWKRGTAAYLVYILLGMVGMPVFSSFRGGVGHLLGPTGGYIIGFIPMALLAGLAISKSGNRIVQLLGMAVGTVIAYAFATAWHCVSTGSAVLPALALCVFPFIPFDLAKMAFVMLTGPMIRSRLVRAGLHPGRD